MCKRILTLAALYFALSGCVIELVSGPTEVQIGSVVEYVVRLTAELSAPTLQRSFVGVVAIVPNSWELVDSSYTGDLGDGTMVEDFGTVFPLGGVCGAPWPDDYQRILIADSLFGIKKGAVALASLQFLVGGPPKKHELRFIGYHTVGSGDCTDPATISVTQTRTPVTEVPSVSPGGLAFLALALVAGGVFVMARRG